MTAWLLVLIALTDAVHDFNRSLTVTVNWLISLTGLFLLYIAIGIISLWFSGSVLSLVSSDSPVPT